MAFHRRHTQNATHCVVGVLAQFKCTSQLGCVLDKGRLHVCLPNEPRVLPGATATVPNAKRKQLCRGGLACCAPLPSGGAAARAATATVGQLHHDVQQRCTCAAQSTGVSWHASCKCSNDKKHHHVAPSEELQLHRRRSTLPFEHVERTVIRTCRRVC